jgi:hypothetical protein
LPLPDKIKKELDAIAALDKKMTKCTAEKQLHTTWLEMLRSERAQHVACPIAYKAERQKQAADIRMKCQSFREKEKGQSNDSSRVLIGILSIGGGMVRRIGISIPGIISMGGL